MAEQYHFKTEWVFDAPLDKVWMAISNICHYPDIWRDFRCVQVRVGDGRSVGSIIDAETRGSLPYTLKYSLEVQRSDEPTDIELRSTGDLIGLGRWKLTSLGPDRTEVFYYWDVATNRRILNLIAPLAKGLLAQNHDQVMERGYLAFCKELGLSA